METPPSPPDEVQLSSSKAAMGTVARVLAAKGEALTLLSRQFQAPPTDGGFTNEQFERALNLMRQTVLGGGKLIYTGMGKSLKIASKLVATLTSFSIPAVELHPSDALHGDIGVISCSDVIIAVSASGNSPEIMAMLNHAPPGVPVICVTCETSSPLAKVATAVLAAPLPPHLREMALYGLPAPTVSTTLCLAVGDALSIALYEFLELDAKRRHHEFLRCHPGGAIGANAAIATPETPWDLIPRLSLPLKDCPEIDLWRAAALAPVVCAASTCYRSADLVMALENKHLLKNLPGVQLAQASSVRGQGLCVLRDENNRPTAVVWD